MTVLRLLFSGIVMLFMFQIRAQDKIEFKDSENNLLISIEDEGNAGSISLPSLTTAPTETQNKLYDFGGLLYYNGYPVLDNMGNHIAVQNLQIGSYWLSGDGDDEGVLVDEEGWTGVNRAVPLASLHVEGKGEFESGTGQVTDGLPLAGGSSSGNNWNINGNVASKNITSPSISGNYQVVKSFEAGDQIHFNINPSNVVPGGYVRIKPSSSGTWTSWALGNGNVTYICPGTEDYDLEFQYNSTCNDILGTCIPTQSISVTVTRTHTVPIFSDEPIALFTGGGNVGIGTESPTEKLSVEGIIESKTGGVKFPDGSVQSTAGESDNLGDHVAVQNVQTTGNWISSDGDDEGLNVSPSGWTGINQGSPLASLHVQGTGQYGVDPVPSTVDQAIEGGTSSGSIPWTVLMNAASVNISTDSQTGTYAFSKDFDQGDDVNFQITLSAMNPTGVVRIRPQGGGWTTFSFSGDVTETFTCPISATYDIELVYNSTCFATTGDCIVNQNAQITVTKTSYTYTYLDEPIALFSGGGNVGIGTDTPSEKLSVNGTIESISGGMKFPDGTTQTTAAATDTDDQTLSIVLDELFISEGNSIDLTPYKDNTDDQTLSIALDELFISEGNSVDLTPYKDDTDDQTLSITLDELFISEGNSVDLSQYKDDTDDQAMSFTGTTLSIDDGNSVNLSSLKDNLGNHTATQTINTNNHWISGDGGNEGVYISDNGSVGVGTTSPGAKFDVSGTTKIGTNGTALNSVIKVTKNVNFPNVPSNDVIYHNITGITNATIGSTVFISPSSDFPGSLYIGNCYVSANGTVRVQLLNEGSNGQNVGAMDYYITIIN